MLSRVHKQVVALLSFLSCFLHSQPDFFLLWSFSPVFYLPVHDVQRKQEHHLSFAYHPNGSGKENEKKKAKSNQANCNCGIAHVHLDKVDLVNCKMLEVFSLYHLSTTKVHGREAHLKSSCC